MYSKVIEKLQQSQVTYIIHEHQPAVTVADAEQYLTFPKENFLKTIAFKVKNGNWVLVALRGADKVDYRKLAEAIGSSRDKIIRPPPEQIEAELGYQVGGICPIAIDQTTIVVLDEAAVKLDTVFCGTGRNDRTLEIKVTDLRKIGKMKVVRVSA